jgi:hypothetical protein
MEKSTGFNVLLEYMTTKRLGKSQLFVVFYY